METLITIGILAAVGIAVDKIQKRRKKPKTHGSAAWMSLYQAARLRLFKSGGVILGDWKRGTLCPVKYHGPSNILCLGPPGTGKGSSVLTPNALHLSHMVLIDPDAEVTGASIKAWRDKGYTV